MACRNLTEVIIPDNVEVLEDFAFNGCDNIKYFKIGNGIKKLKTFFSASLNKLEKVELSDSIISLDGTFRDCEKLTNIKLPEKLKKIGYFTFYHCKNLHSLNIAKSVVSIGRNAFRDCNLERIDYGGNKLKWKIISRKAKSFSSFAGNDCTVVCTNGIIKTVFPWDWD